jgi:hypothetical protein
LKTHKSPGSVRTAELIKQKVNFTVWDSKAHYFYLE